MNCLLSILKTIGLIVLFLTIHLLPSPTSAAIPLNGTSGNLLNLDLKVLVAGKPIYFILVEKDFQRLRVLEHDGRINVLAEYFAVTGENLGRKEVEGDEKTPEGVYFITKTYVDKKITVFGNRAFHLNYPNIYDQSDGRSGNGIYIHGTNRELRSNSTNGCITLNNTDLDDLAQYLSVGGIPVIVVSSLYDEIGNKGLYPDLTADDFSLAKELLIVDHKQNDLDFVSLYLIRAAGQTVAAGEYKAGNISSRSLYSAAYLDISQEKGWFVVDRGPGSDTLYAASEELVPTVQDMVEKGQTPSPFAQEAWSELWEPKNEDIYLGWYRDSVSHGDEITPAVLVAESGTNTLSPGKQKHESKLTYGLIILAICISLGSVLIFRRIQPRQDSTSPDPKTEQKIKRLTAEKLAGEQLTKSIQKELDRAKGSLRLVQEQMQEEKSSMENDLEARIEALELELEDKQAEIDQLSTEKAALKLKGMSHLSGQVEELGTLKVELSEAKEQLDEARQNSARLPVLESMIAAQKDETNRLAAENAAWKMNEVEASATTKAETQNFQNQIASLEAQLREEIERRNLSESKVLSSVAAEHDLAAAQAETAQLRQELKTLHESNQHSELEQEITTLRGRVSVYKSELSSECEQRELLADQLKTAQETEQELRARTASIEQLENENSRLKEELSANDLEEELSLLHERLASYETEIASKSTENANLSTQLRSAHATQEELESTKTDIINRLENDNSRLKEELEANNLQEEVSTLQERLASYEAEIASKDSENTNLSSQLRSAQVAQEELESAKTDAINRLENENSRLKEELEANNLEEEVSLLRERLTSYENDLAVKTNDNSELTSQLHAAQAAQMELSASKTEDINRLEDDNNRLKEELEANNLQEEVSALRSQLAFNENVLSEERDQNKELTTQLKETIQLEEELASTKATIEKLDEENKALRESPDHSQELEELTALRSQLEEQADTLLEERSKSTRLESRLSRLSELEEIVLARQVEVTSLTNELESLKGKEQSSSEQIITLQRQLDDMQAALSIERAQRLEVTAVQDAPATTLEQEPLYADAPEPLPQEEFVKEPIEFVKIDKTVEPVEPTPEPSTSAIDDGLRTHGTQFLPEDVLKKWIS